MTASVFKKLELNLTTRTLDSNDDKIFEQMEEANEAEGRVDNNVEEKDSFRSLQESGHSSSHHSHHDSKVTLAKNETRAVCCFRTILLLILAVVATTVSIVVYTYALGTETNHFETEYIDYATKIVDSFQSNAKRRLYAIESLSTSITSYAISNHLEWPYVTLPDFERRVHYTLDLAEVLSVSFLPIVTNRTRSSWCSYTRENHGWFEEGLELQKSIQGDYKDDTFEQENLEIMHRVFGTNNRSEIPKDLWKLQKGVVGQMVENDPGPFYAAWWQYAPVLPLKSLINYNAVSNPARTHEIKSILTTKQPVTSRSFDISGKEAPTSVATRALLNLFLNRYGKEYQYGPMSDLYIPVFDKYDTNERSVVALLTSYVYWQAYFTEILPDKAHGFMAILENTCNQTFSYLIDGPKAKYLGPGDMHDRKFDHLEVTTGFGAFLEKLEFVDIEEFESLLEQGQCMYNVRVYPTKQMEDKYMTKTPLIFTVALLMAFVFTSFVFIIYDCLVERRQKLVMKAAVQSTEVVQSLFPEVVRDRLYEEKESGAKSAAKGMNVKTFLQHKAASQSTAPPVSEMVIADLYENCTVLFCDIAGFTKWSSNREPTKVFTLLETLYGAFDKLAKRYGAEKIETIGDCYLAVTGLPDPQDDHAVIMAMFASHCLTKFDQVKHKLSKILGPDTLDLNLRYGLHSGPVTAGVLRGEKARFQLFGDTVNTASRMESTGVPGKIQSSAATAELMIAAGKDAWVCKREDLVKAKGKGTLQTYWIEPKLMNGGSLRCAGSFE